jgi:hypothetical protein
MTGRGRALLAVLTVFLALGLSSCGRVEIEYEVHSDETVDATINFGVSRNWLDERAKERGVTSDELLADIKAEAAVRAEALLGTPFEVKDYAEDGYLGPTLTSARSVPLSAMDSDVVKLEVVRQGGDLHLSGTVDLTDQSRWAWGDSLTAEPSSITLQLKFPGRVQSSNGTVAGTKATFYPKVGEVNEITAVASAASSWTLPIRVMIGTAALLAIVALVLVLLRARSRARHKRAKRDVPSVPRQQHYVFGSSVGRVATPVAPLATAPLNQALSRQSAPPTPFDPQPAVGSLLQAAPQGWGQSAAPQSWEQPIAPPAAPVSPAVQQLWDLASEQSWGQEAPQPVPPAAQQPWGQDAGQAAARMVEQDWGQPSGQPPSAAEPQAWGQPIQPQGFAPEQPMMFQPEQPQAFQPEQPQAFGTPAQPEVFQPELPDDSFWT